MAADLFSIIRAQPPTAGKIFLETPAGTRTSYGDLLASCGRLANALVALGVKPGDRVAVQVEKSPEAVFLYLACLRAGAVFLPLNTAYTLAELDYFLGDAEPKVVVCGPRVHEGLLPIAKARGVGLQAEEMS